MHKFWHDFLFKRASILQRLQNNRQLCTFIGYGSALITSLALYLNEAYAEHPSTIDGSARDILFIDDHRILFQGNAEVNREALQIHAEQLEYDKDTDLAKANGQVCIKRNDLIVNGPRAQLQLDANEGYMDHPVYKILRTQGHGTAEKIYFLGPQKYRAEQVIYSTCNLCNPAWFLYAKRLDIDDERKLALGHDSVMYFMGIPIAASPYLSLPLSDERRSGILPPTVGVSSNGGVDITLPYYFNIAPQRDLTVFPRLLSKRGTQLGAIFRYLEHSYQGDIQAEFLPNDRILRRDRWFYRIQHQQQLFSGLNFYIDHAKVSDDNYPSDLARSLSSVVQQQFNQEIGFNYNRGYWIAQARVQKFQTLAPNMPPFNREPQINVRYQNRDMDDFILSTETDFTEFRNYNDPLTGSKRIFIKPEISYSYRTPGYFFTPTASLHASSYLLTQPFLGSAYRRIQRVVPTVSFDAGLIFERSISFLPSLFKKGLLQTLEPRLFYVYTPFREQSNIPLFDTASTDFNLTQIFSEQPFIGNDRIADNNKLTVGLMSRLLEADNGIERARFVLAQRLDLQGQRVTLTNTAIEAKRNYSDVLAGASVRLFSDIAIESAAQYNLEIKQLQRSSFDLSWRPGVRRILNFGYRYQRPNDVLVSPLRQFVMSAQWPITTHLYGIARANYDRAGHKMVDSLVGFEYEADCWIGRIVLQRFTNNFQKTTSNFYFQIEFKGLMKAGMSADTIFKLNVPGYTPISKQSF